jgi:hypothetical protein
MDHHWQYHIAGYIPQMNQANWIPREMPIEATIEVVADWLGIILKLDESNSYFKALLWDMM